MQIYNFFLRGQNFAKNLSENCMFCDGLGTKKREDHNFKLWPSGYYGI